MERTKPQEPRDVRLGLAWLREADPVLAKVIDEHPALDPNAWIQRMPTLDLFGALVFQVIGQQISVIAATAIFARLVERFDGRAPSPDELVDLDPETLRDLGLSRRKANTVLDLAQRFIDGRLSEAGLSRAFNRSIRPSRGVHQWRAPGVDGRDDLFGVDPLEVGAGR